VLVERLHPLHFEGFETHAATIAEGNPRDAMV